MSEFRLEENASSLLDELFSSSFCDPSAAAEIRRIVERGADFDCYKINAYRVASAIGAGRAETLRAFLFAARLGIFDLNWDIHCPSCHGIPEYHRHIMGLRKKGHCDLCEIDWDLDIENQVEVTFTVNPGVRRISYPGWRTRTKFGEKMEFLDEVLAREGRELTVGICVYPDRAGEAAGDFTRGEYIFYMPSYLEEGGRLVVSDQPASKPQAFDIHVSERGEMLEKDLSAASGRIDFRVHSKFPGMNGFLVVPDAPRNNWVSAACVTSFQDFRDLFSGEFLSPDASFALKSVTLMFTDITGSTALYERLGDAAAFAAVREHFVVMTGIVRRHGGAVVKTIGDAVMASFPVNSGAVAAAFDIQRAFSSGAVRNGEIRVKIGLHRGPAIAVTSNRSIDFFGRTVNIAARVQGCCRNGEVLMSGAVVEDPGAAAVISASGLPLVRREESLKGIDGAFATHSVGF